MSIPDTLSSKIEVFRETGHVNKEGSELFVDSWQQVMLGQGLMPEHYHPLVDSMSEQEMRDFMQHVRAGVDQSVSRLQDHNVYRKDYLSGAITPPRS